MRSAANVSLVPEIYYAQKGGTERAPLAMEMERRSHPSAVTFVSRQTGDVASTEQMVGQVMSGLGLR
jgi:hypothetical protein